jgi:hypothetical protein
MSSSIRPKTCRTLPCRTFRPQTFNNVKLLTQKKNKIQGKFCVGGCNYGFKLWLEGLACLRLAFDGIYFK